MMKATRITCHPPCLSPRRSSPIHLRITTCSAAAPSAAPSAAVQTFHSLPDRTKLEVLTTRAANPVSSTPLVLIHGSYHAAWCWTQRFAPYLGEAGYTCHAISLRGQGGSDREGLKVGGTLQSHADDIAHYLQTLTTNKNNTMPVVIAHSMGGAVLQYMLANASTARHMSGAVLLASAPPSGVSSMVGRMLKATPLTTLQVSWSFMSRDWLSNEDACRRMFFSKQLPADDMRGYWQLFQQYASPIPVVDVRSVRQEFPPPPPITPLPPVLVAGGTLDTIVDIEGVHDTARVLETKPVLYEGMAHDLMLDAGWERVAGDVLQFVQGIDAQGRV